MSVIQPYFSMTYAQRKAMYDRMYDEAGNMKVPKAEDFKILDVPGWDGKPGEMNGYTAEKVGDDYVIFAMNPTANFSGGKELTQEQLAYLRGKYDMDNLSKEDRIKLLAELSCFGVISGSDAYAEAFPEKFPSVQKQQQQFGIRSDDTDMSAWIEYYLQQAMLAKKAMDNMIANASRFNTIPYVEPQRRANTFYTTLAKVMNQIQK